MSRSFELHKLNGIEIKQCVACNSEKLNMLLDLGKQALANDYLSDLSSFIEYPLSVKYCQKCFHIQLDFSVHPDLLFRNYVYVSGTTKTLDEYFNSFVNKMNAFNFSEKKVLEIASNDGSLLKKFNDQGWDSIGVDPAQNLLSLSSEKKVMTIPEYFNLNLTEHLAKDYPLVIALNVFAHTNSPITILHGVKKILAEDGVFVIQTSQSDMVINNQIDTIYHEHISFFNVRSMQEILNRAGLFFSGLEITPIHGNSYIWYVTKKPISLPQQKNIIDRLQIEKQQGLFQEEKYVKYNEEAFRLRETVIRKINYYKEKGYKIVVYGAAAKGNTFLNFCSIRNKTEPLCFRRYFSKCEFPGRRTGENAICPAYKGGFSNQVF